MSIKAAREIEIIALLNRAVQAGIFPGAVAAWGLFDRPPLLAWAGQKGLSRQQTKVSEATVYDLASLTKLLATTALIMNLTYSRRLDPLKPLSPADLYRPPGWESLTAGHLMSHQAGLPAWRPFHQELAEVAAPERPKALGRAVFEKRLAEPGRVTLYSDLGFMILGLLIEKIMGGSISDLFNRLLARPLGLYGQIGFMPLSWSSSGRLAPTEDAPRLPGPLDYPGLLSKAEVPLGRVNDDNAQWLGGAAGHAGLFGNVQAVWQMMTVLIGGRSGLFDAKTSLCFQKPRQPSEGGLARAWGFDVKSPHGGALAESGWSARSVGHLGYTGTSVWYDPDKHFGAVLLSNRIHPTAANLAINNFRPVFHRAVLKKN